MVSRILFVMSIVVVVVTKNHYDSAIAVTASCSEITSITSYLTEISETELNTQADFINL